MATACSTCSVRYGGKSQTWRCVQVQVYKPGEWGGGGAGGVRGGGGHSSMGYNCGRCVDVGDVGEEATNYFTFECESETITIAHVRG